MDIERAEREARHLETLLVHGRWEEVDGDRPTLPPIHLTTAHDFASAERMEAIFARREEGHYYSRMSNPTVEALERRITDSCGAAGTLALASGMSAIMLGMMNMLRAGDEMIASPCLFGGTYTLFARVLSGLGIVTHFADPSDPAAWEALIGPNTRALFTEAVANPAMVVPDFAALRALADRHGLPLVVDATLLTPYLYDPEAMQADLLMFSATKYLAGPASTVAGLVVDTGRFPWHRSEMHPFTELKAEGQGAYMARLRRQMMSSVGPCLSPLSAYLLLTGMETLPLRLERQCDNAERAAVFLREHPAVKAVHFPGLPDHPAHELCKRQFRGRFGAMVSFTLADKEACFRFINALRLVRRSANLGDTRSLVIHPASTIHSALWQHEREQAGVTEDLIRFSLGIEHCEDVLADLDQALRAA